MADDKRFPALSQRYVPAPSPARLPRASDPSLPSSSGAWLGSRTRIMRKDEDFLRQHAAVLAAKATQSTNMKTLVDARIALALKLAELSSLPELIEHQWLKGLRDRAHELRMLDLAHDTVETDAKTLLAAAQMRLAQYLPIPESSAPSAAPAGLTPSDVQKAAQMMPELKPETIETLLLMLNGLIAEKSK